MIEIPKWLRNADPALLPELHRKIADLIGYDKMLDLVAVYSGDYLYVPKLDAIVRAVRNESLLADHRKGMQPPALAHRYNLSVVQGYEIIKQSRTAEDDGQVSFLDKVI